jgi:hypothetical protein
MAASRCAASLVALALSGAPQVIAMQAPIERHRCACRAHGSDHECSCSLCRRAALQHQSSDESTPPCHRAAARAALAQQEHRPASGAPCVEGTCGQHAQPPVTIAGIESFVLPTVKAIAVPWRVERIWRKGESLHERSLDPETPPPRRA